MRHPFSRRHSHHLTLLIISLLHNIHSCSILTGKVTHQVDQIWFQWHQLRFNQFTTWLLDLLFKCHIEECIPYRWDDIDLWCVHWFVHLLSGESILSSCFGTLCTSVSLDNELLIVAGKTFLLFPHGLAGSSWRAATLCSGEYFCVVVNVLL